MHFYFDIDGTLLSRGQKRVSPITENMLMQLNSWGLSTMRDAFRAQSVFRKVKPNLPTIALGGAQVRVGNNVVNYSTLNESETSEMVSKFLKNTRDVKYCIGYVNEQGSDLLYARTRESLKYYLVLKGRQTVVFSTTDLGRFIYRLRQERPLLVQFKYRSKVQNPGSGSKSSLNVVSEENRFYITKAGVSKATALGYVKTEFIKSDFAKLAYVGDSEFDQEAMNKADVSIAIGNKNLTADYHVNKVEELVNLLPEL